MEEMEAAILARGGELFKDNGKHIGEEFLTMRGKLPGIGAADFVLPRKDGSYTDGRHPNSVEVGTLEEDLARRDFTVNAMAQEEGTNNLVDLFGGKQDLANKILRCVGNAKKRMAEDALRALRAIRFSITKCFSFDSELRDYLISQEAADALANISTNRIRDELHKCFLFDTPKTISILEAFWRIRRAVFAREIRLVPTVYEK